MYTVFDCMAIIQACFLLLHPEARRLGGRFLEERNSMPGQDERLVRLGLGKQRTHLLLFWK